MKLHNIFEICRYHWTALFAQQGTGVRRSEDDAVDRKLHVLHGRPLPLHRPEDRLRSHGPTDRRDRILRPRTDPAVREETRQEGQDGRTGKAHGRQGTGQNLKRRRKGNTLSDFARRTLPSKPRNSIGERDS